MIPLNQLHVFIDTPSLSVSDQNDDSLRENCHFGNATNAINFNVMDSFTGSLNPAGNRYLT
jgi:hypothetical protein